MKKSILALFICLATLSCSEEGDLPLPAPSSQIEFSMTPSSNNIGIAFTGAISTIDWGTGVNTVNLQSSDNEKSALTHTFGTLLNEYRIKIDSKNLTSIAFSSDDIRQGSFSIGQCPNLKSLELTFGDSKKSTQKPVLNLTYCPQLTTFNCYNSRHSSILFPNSNKLEELSISSEEYLSTLQLNSQTKLKKLKVSDTRPSTIILPKNGILEELELTRAGNIRNLDLNGNKNIKQLTIRSCLTYNIDVRNLSQLEQLNCYQNALNTLDIFNNIDLTILNCADNRLTQINIANNRKLTHINCSKNDMSASDLNNLFGQLPFSTSETKPLISIGKNPGTDTCDKIIAENKGWEVWTSWDE